VGCGFIARRHLDAWACLDGARIVALCDRHPERTAGLASTYGVPWTFTSMPKLLSAIGDRLDFVDVALPPQAHVEAIRTATARGLHVLCQKPLTAGPDEIAVIKTLLAQTDRIVAVNEMWKWLPLYRRVGELLRAGEVGEINKVRLSSICNLLLPRLEGQPQLGAWPRFRTLQRLVIGEYGPHGIDLMRTWFGEPRALRARTSRLNADLIGEDAAEVDLDMSGFTAELRLDWARPGTPTADALDGETLLIRGTEGLLTVVSASELTLRREGTVRRERYDGDPRVEAFGSSQRDFVEAVLTGRPPASGADDYLLTDTLVHAAYSSAAGGGAEIREPTAPPALDG
jgi:predicted dehydrogenase